MENLPNRLGYRKVSSIWSLLVLVPERWCFGLLLLDSYRVTRCIFMPTKLSGPSSPRLLWRRSIWSLVSDGCQHLPYVSLFSECLTCLSHLETPFQALVWVPGTNNLCNRSTPYMASFGAGFLSCWRFLLVFVCAPSHQGFSVCKNWVYLNSLCHSETQRNLCTTCPCSASTSAASHPDLHRTRPGRPSTM